MSKDTKSVRDFNFPSLPAFLALPRKNEDRMSLSSNAFSDVPSDIIIKSRIKYGGRWSACKGLLMEYSKSTTIHGIRYLFEVHRPIYEKIYWLVLLMTSFYFAVSLIWDTYLKWQDSPVILGFDETLVPVHKIPFPTITICPEIKIDQNLFNFGNVTQRFTATMHGRTGSDEFFGNIGNITDNEILNVAAALHICEREVALRFLKYFQNNNLRQDIAQTLVDLSISKNETAPFCQWNGRYYFCNEILKFVATDEGICYQFNGLQNEDIYRDARYLSYTDTQIVDFNNYFDVELPPLNNITGNWSLDNGYMEQGYNSYPQRTVFSSARKGLFVFLQGFEHNIDYTCRHDRLGYKVFLNSPESVPVTSGNYILVSHFDEVIVSVLPHYVMSTKNLHSYEPQKRQCYFNDERYLRYFRYYSQSNCQTECLANFTVSKCGCAKFWMPKPIEVPVCGITDINCYIDAETELNTILQSQTMHASVNSSIKIMCDCMPACTSLDYNFEISRARYNINETLQAFREEYEHSDVMASRLSVYFKERQFTAIKRTVLFSVTTLIANCGGIFGLFMGISSLSIIELLYFFSVRLYDNLHKRRQSKKRMMEYDSAFEFPSE